MQGLAVVAEPVLPVIFELLRPELLIIVYLYYEIHHGRIRAILAAWEKLQPMVLALALVVDGVDHEAVTDRLDVAPHNATPFLAGPVEVIDWEHLSDEERDLVENVVDGWRESKQAHHQRAAGGGDGDE